MRENRTYGSEGGEAKAFPTPISRGTRRSDDISGEAAESGESKPCSVVVFWVLAFASMTHVRKARPVLDCRR
jgi:hypothetical protein